MCKCSRFFGKEICFWDLYPILPPSNSFGPFYRLYYSGTFINEHLRRATTRYITAKSSGPDWNYNDFTECKATSQERPPLYILRITSSFIVPVSFSNSVWSVVRWHSGNSLKTRAIYRAKTWQIRRVWRHWALTIIHIHCACMHIIIIIIMCPAYSLLYEDWLYTCMHALWISSIIYMVKPRHQRPPGMQPLGCARFVSCMHKILSACVQLIIII